MFSNYESHGHISSIMTRVFGWMGLALSITGITSWYISHSPALISFVMQTPGIFLILLLLQLGMVVYLSARLQTMSPGAAIGTFLFYSFLIGVTFSGLFLAYTQESIFLSFFVTAATFVTMAVYGAVTRADLSSMGNYLVMGVFGLIICLLINMFLQSSGFDYLISIAGVIIFTLLTAYDVQQIQRIARMVGGDSANVTRVSILGALKLYLDFINLFLYLLRFFGQRRD